MCATRRSLLLLTTAVLLSVAVFCDSAAADRREHPVKPVIRIARRCLKKVESLPGYHATLTKTERVNNTVISQRMRIKFRRQPFSVYLYFEGDLEGREVIYVEGRNNGNLLAHETGLAGLVGTLQLSPTGTQAMAENRHPITMSGIENFLRAAIEQWEKESKYGETEVNYYKDAKLGVMTCRVIEVSHPKPRKQFPCHRTRLWIDDETGMAVRLQQYGFPVHSGDRAPILQDYAFTNLRTDVRVTDRDFDHDNPKYNF